MHAMQRKHQWHLLGASLLAIFAFVVSPLVSAKVPESSDPIVITLNDWDTQLVNSYIAGGILEKMGYNVKYQAADYLAQFSGIESGDLTVAMEIWETTALQQYNKAISTGEVINLGSVGAKAIEDWWYPDYVAKQCPGLPDWKALKKCAKVFMTPKTAPKGRFLGGAVTWDIHSKQKIEALGLPFEVIHAGTAAALNAAIISAVQRKQPIVAWTWTPNWLTAQIPGHFVNFPKYSPECYTDPSWGINKKLAYDCGNPRGWIRKVAWKGGQDKWPAAYRLLHEYKQNAATLGALSKKVSVKGWKPQKAATWWINNNPKIWEKWIHDAKAGT